MKISRHHTKKRGPLTNLKELHEEKFRLQTEILETEEGMKENYRSLVDALTFRNIINTIAEEVVATNMVVSQAYSIIRPLFTRKKKKKKRVEVPGSGGEASVTRVEVSGSKVEALGTRVEVSGSKVEVKRKKEEGRGKKEEEGSD